MRPRQLRRRVGVVAAAIILVGTGIGWAAKADATPEDYAYTYGPAVCSTLDEFPSFGGVTGVGEGEAISLDSGYSLFRAGQIIAISVNTYCPRHKQLLQAYVQAGQGVRA